MEFRNLKEFILALLLVNKPLKHHNFKGVSLIKLPPLQFVQTTASSAEVAGQNSKVTRLSSAKAPEFTRPRA